MLKPLLLAFTFVAVCFAQPDTAWLFTYPASEFGESQPLAAFFDDTGNVYVAGWSQKNPDRPDVLLLKIDSLGQLVWDRTYPDVIAVGAARDTVGNIYITGSSTDTSDGWLYMLKYTSKGDLVWAKNYTEPHRRFSSLGIALDDSQNVYACGEAESASCGIVRILKYRPDGALAGRMSYMSSETTSLGGGWFRILNDGGAYLALNAYRHGGWGWSCHLLIVRLSSQGQVLWKRTYMDSKWDQIKWSQVDADDNIYITGQATTTIDGFCTMKVDSSGKMMWTAEYPRSGPSDGGNAFLMPHDVNVYVASGGWDTIRLAKYDSLGNQQWLSKYGNENFMLGYGQGYDDPCPDFCCMNVDDSGNVYLTGQGDTTYRLGPGRGNDTVFGFLLKYDPNGKLVWAKKRPWTGWLSDGGADVTWSGALVGFDKKGALYEVGLGGADAERGLYVLKYRTR